MTSDRNQRGNWGVDVQVAEGVLATFIWVQPGWKLWQCPKLPAAADPDGSFPTLAEAAAYVRQQLGDEPRAE